VSSRRTILARAAASVAFAAACLPSAFAQAPNAAELQKRVKAALEASDDAADAALGALKDLPALSKSEAQTWTTFVAKWIPKSPGLKIEGRGVSYLYDADDRKNRKGKYMTSGGPKGKGLVFGLHGGGVGSADCGPAASSWRGAISSAGMIGIYPEAIEATEAAWGDDVTVKFFHDLLAAARRSYVFDPNKVYVVGHSMGGYGAWTWGGRFADRFAGAVSFAGGPTPIFQNGDRSMPVVDIEDGVLANFRNVPLWDYHSRDDLNVPFPPVKFAIEAHQALGKANPGFYKLHYEEVDGRGHAFPEKGPGPAIDWITKFARNPRPKRITFQAFYVRPDASYWAWFNPARRGATLQATWTTVDGVPEFVVDGEVAEASDFSILLDDKMADLDKPVRVKLRDKVVFEGVAKRTLVELVASARRRLDPEMLFVARSHGG
jgi:pimeloyl-ACP methyl ester carboxylesterase